MFKISLVESGMWSAAGSGFLLSALFHLLVSWSSGPVWSWGIPQSSALLRKGLVPHLALPSFFPFGGNLVHNQPIAREKTLVYICFFLLNKDIGSAAIPLSQILSCHKISWFYESVSFPRKMKTTNYKLSWENYAVFTMLIELPLLFCWHISLLLSFIEI